LTRTLALVDGEHYPPVVRAALEQAAAGGPVVAALLLGGSEKLRGAPDYGVPLEHAGGDAATAMVAAARAHGAGRVLDLSDEPVLGAGARLRLVSHALAAGLRYDGPDFAFTPPPQAPAGVPAIAVIGTGKRVGKTAVSAHAARVLAAAARDPASPVAGRDPVVVAMGRGGPPEPELVPAGEDVDVAELLRRARAGAHAASDFLEDAALARVATVGCRRCGGGLAGATYLSNVEEGVALARSEGARLLLLEGSGAALPPVAADRTLLVVPASVDPASLTDAFGPFRVLRADLAVMTMCEPPAASPAQVAAVRAALRAVRPGLAVIATVLRPEPAAAVPDGPVVLFTTASAGMHGRIAASLAADHGVRVSLVSGALSDREALRHDLDRPEARSAAAYLVEIKAAAIDVVAEAAERRGIPVVFCDNRPVSLPGEPGLDDAIRRLAAEAVAHG
jgi:cyclic 2,3-diphosphoglycerate synthetase